MAEFSKLILTNSGQELLAKMIAGKGNISFTKVVTSSAAYEESQIQGLTALSEVKQTSLISKVTRTNEVAIKVECAFTNVELAEGYYLRALGLYAIDPELGEILYAAAREVSGNCYMPPYNGVTVSGAYIELITTVGNAQSVSLEVDPAGFATIKDIKNLESILGTKTDLTDFNNHVNNPDIHVSEAQTENNNIAITGLIAHKEDKTVHITEGEREAWNGAVDTANKGAADAADALQRVTNLESRVSHVEDGLFSNITGNPFLVSFDSLDGVKLVKGIWNVKQQRIEC